MSRSMGWIVGEDGMDSVMGGWINEIDDDEDR